MTHPKIIWFILATFFLASCAPALTTSQLIIRPARLSPTENPTPVLTPDFPAPTQALPTNISPNDIAEEPNSYITVTPQESNDLLINPGKGWILYYPYQNIPGEIWDLVSVCYARLDWSTLEPAEGDFQWASIDDGIRDCSARGKKFAFGIMPANSSSAKEYVTPRWFFTSGSKSTAYKGESGQWLQAPVWNDPVYVQKMQNLIDAVALRYDGDRNIAFIDARNCGNWGEWHSLGCSELLPKDKAILIDQWKVFHQAVIVVPTNGDIVEFQAHYGVDSYGFGVRRDSSETDQNAAAYAFDKSPAVSEWSAPYKYLKTCQGWSHVCWAENLIPDYMRKSKFSYDNLGQWGADPLNFYAENTDLARVWANKMGYWFKLTEATLPAKLGTGSVDTLSFTVRNDGVAPIYLNKNQSYVRLALLDSAGKVLVFSEALPGINPFAWKPGLVSSETASFQFPQTQNAAYLAIGLFSSLSITEPDIKLGNIGVLPSNWFPLQRKSQPEPIRELPAAY